MCIRVSEFSEFSSILDNVTTTSRDCCKFTRIFYGTEMMSNKSKNKIK